MADPATTPGGVPLVPVSRIGGEVVYVRSDKVDSAPVLATFNERGARQPRDVKVGDISGAPEGSGFWETGLGNYLRNSYDAFSRGAKSARETLDAFTPGPGAVASMLPGAGIVQGNEDFQRGRAALGEGRYGQAAADYGIGMVNAGTDMVPMFAALPPLVVKSANMPPIVRSSERGMVRSEAPWKKGEDFRLTGVSTNKVPPDENPYNAQSMDPVIGVPVQAHHNVDDVLAGLAEVYDSGRGLPPNVENGDYGSFAKWLDDPAVRALVEKRIGEARGADLIPQDADSDLWVALHAQRNPRSGWARWLGPDAPPERRAEIEQRAREMDAAERARSEELGKRGAAFDAYMAAGNMPPSPHGAAAWKAANPGRAPTYFQYDDATGNWSVSDTPYPKGNR